MALQTISHHRAWVATGVSDAANGAEGNRAWGRLVVVIAILGLAPFYALTSVGRRRC